MAPDTDALCSMVRKLVSVDDCLALRAARGLADLYPKTRATVHGSVYVFNGKQAPNNLAQIFREVLGSGSN